MDKTLEEFFHTLTGSPWPHVKWLNTLSFLEYIGARKIIKSQHATELDGEMVEHIAEEARHALFFKKLAHKVCPSEKELTYGESDLLEGKQSERYFQDLDAMVTEELEEVQTRLNYLYVTITIEHRAMILYRAYARFMQKKQMGREFQLQEVLQDEARHLQKTESLIKEIDHHHFSERKKHFLAEEAPKFHRLLSAWTNALAQY